MSRKNTYFAGKVLKNCIFEQICPTKALFLNTREQKTQNNQIVLKKSQKVLDKPKKVGYNIMRI